MTLHASPERVTIDGPDVQLGPKAGLSMSLLLHELGANAIKYGALSNETGRVSLTWTMKITKMNLKSSSCGMKRAAHPS